MEIIKREQLFKSRSYGATIRAAYTSFLENYKLIFRRTWPFLCAFSLLAPIVVLTSFAQRAGQFNPSVWGAYLLASLLLEVVAFLFYGRLTMFVNEQSYKWNVVRYLKAWLWQMLLIVVVSVVIGVVAGLVAVGVMPAEETAAPAANPMAAQAAQQMAILKVFGVTFVLFMVLALLLLPYIPVFMKYFAEPLTHMRKLIFKQFSVYMHYWGYIFLTMLITFIALFVLLMVIALPMIIMAIALVSSNSGVANGDEAGLPAYFGWMAYGICALTFFVYTFVSIFSFFVVYYIYGSIEAREIERKDVAVAVEE